MLRQHLVLRQKSTAGLSNVNILYISLFKKKQERKEAMFEIDLRKSFSSLPCLMLLCLLSSWTITFLFTSKSTLIICSLGDGKDNNEKPFLIIKVIRLLHLHCTCLGSGSTDGAVLMLTSNF